MLVYVTGREREREREFCGGLYFWFCLRFDVILCLSEHVRNDTLHDAKHTISKECRQQLRAQLFQQRENIDFDPRLKKACTDDMQKLCAQVQKGSAQV
jgi:Golgi apparatus protein 1